MRRTHDPKSEGSNPSLPIWAGSSIVEFLVCTEGIRVQIPALSRCLCSSVAERHSCKVMDEGASPSKGLYMGM